MGSFVRIPEWRLEKTRSETKKIDILFVEIRIFQRIYFALFFANSGDKKKKTREYAMEFLKGDGETRTRYWNAMETNKKIAA